MSAIFKAGLLAAVIVQWSFWLDCEMIYRSCGTGTPTLLEKLPLPITATFLSKAFLIPNQVQIFQPLEFCSTLFPVLEVKRFCCSGVCVCNCWWRLCWCVLDRWWLFVTVRRKGSSEMGSFGSCFFQCPLLEILSFMSTTRVLRVLKWELWYGMELFKSFCAKSLSLYSICIFLVRGFHSGKYFFWICHQFWCDTNTCLEGYNSSYLKCSEYAICLLGWING